MKKYNKFNFIAGDKQTTSVENRSDCGFCRGFKRSFKFIFASGTFPFQNLVQDRQENAGNYTEGLQRASSTGGRIVKSEINESVIRQLKDMISIVKKTEELLYLKMNKSTNNKFRIYYCYEASYPPRQLTKEDKEAGKIIGSIMGIKIVQDESMENDFVLPVVRSTTVKSKFAKVFSNSVI
jgi:hypothetical protein